MRKQTPLLLLLLIITTTLVHAQTFDLYKDRLPVVSLKGLWRFHTGDNPAWADPKFDDSGWSLLQSDRSWDDQGYNGYRGFGWYRFQLVIPAGLPDLSILTPFILDDYELFADGILIGRFGDMPPHPLAMTQGTHLIYKLPKAQNAHAFTPRRIIVAIRVWYSPTADYHLGGGPYSSNGQAGETGLMEDWLDYRLAEHHWERTGLQTLALLETLAGIGTLALFMLRRKEFEYFWFSLNMFSSAFFGWVTISAVSYVFRQQRLDLISYSVSIIGSLAVIAFYQQWLRPRPTWLLKLAVTGILLELPVELLSHLLPGLLSESANQVMLILLNLPSTCWLLVVLVSVARQKSKAHSLWIDARLLMIPVLTGTGVSLFGEAASLSYLMGWQHKLFGAYLTVFDEPFPISLGQLSEALSLLGVFAILVLRFARIQSEQERYATEVEGARHVQQFLIPEDLPRIPGLIIESDYRPAREVGGDFFQVIPNPEDGSALIFVGDVAGKGMQAGMLATLLVGAMRTAATFSRDPAVILSTLNNRLHGKGNATCLALLIESDGVATLVNAGHLPPYLNGRELPMEGALPLGTIPNIEFPILNFQINPGDTLTLISDGILEAQKPDGELFGFDRIIEQLRQSTSATALATAAQDFGQSDDITVLTIARTALANS